MKFQPRCSMHDGGNFGLLMAQSTASVGSKFLFMIPADFYYHLIAFAAIELTVFS
jgi:hypothetical protein